MNIPFKPISSVPLSKADFVSKQTVRWCPGCGDYAILANIQKVMPELDIPKENIVFMLWGNHAKIFEQFINEDKNLILRSSHPSPLSAYKSFFGNKHFSKCNSYLTSKNIKQINW